MVYSQQFGLIVSIIGSLSVLAALVLNRCRKVWLLGAFAAYFSLHALFAFNPRYTAHTTGVLCALAAAGLVTLANLIGKNVRDRRLAWLASAGLVLPLTGCARADKPAPAEEATAEAAFRFCGDGEYARAQRVFTRVLAANPRDAVAYNGRGVAYFKEGRLRLALADFDRAVASAPSKPDPYFNRASCHTVLGDFHEAEKDWERFLSFRDVPSGMRAIGFRRRAALWVTLDDPRRAAEDIASGLRVAPADSPVRRELCNSALILSRWEPGLEKFNGCGR